MVLFILVDLTMPIGNGSESGRALIQPCPLPDPLTRKDTAANGDIPSERALLVDVGACERVDISIPDPACFSDLPKLLTLDGLPGGLEAQADILEVAMATLAGSLLVLALKSTSDTQLLLERLLGLHDNIIIDRTSSSTQKVHGDRGRPPIPPQPPIPQAVDVGPAQPWWCWFQAKRTLQTVPHSSLIHTNSRRRAN